MRKKGTELLPTRDSLLERLKDWEDQQSWGDFYDTYWRLIHSVALRAGLSPNEAEEVLQETVIAVAREIKDFKYDPDRGSFKSWLLTRTRWRIADQFRKRRKHQRLHGSHDGYTDLLERVPDQASESQVPEELWDTEWKQNALAVALECVKQKVEPRTFQVYQLYALKQWPVAKVAKSLGVSRAQVYVSKHRVQKLLKHEMQRLVKRESLPPAEALNIRRK